MNDDERVQRFETAYNRLDRALGKLVDNRGGNRRHSFAARVRHAANRNRRLARHKDELLEIGQLRNAIVHGRTDGDEYIAIPGEKIVRRLEAIEAAFSSPELVIPRFQRTVTILSPDQSLAEAWSLITGRGHSRFPVYDPQRCVGLLTANGFARWCAAHIRNGRLDVDMNDVAVSEVLDIDHRRELFTFVPRTTPVDDAIETFGEQRRLEAILISEHGRVNERPLGMITPRDVANIRG